MISVRQVADDCLGVTGSISVNRDIYGYIFRDNNGRLFGALGNQDILPATNHPTRRSLRAQLELMKGESFNLSMFLVGHENDFSGVVSLADVTAIQYGIQVTRDVYAGADLGIRQIFWRRIGVAEAGGYTVIETRGEAVDITDDFSGPNNGIDVFWVQTIQGAGGWCNQDGPCDKDAKDEQTGVVIQIQFNTTRFTGILLGHELGHYLGLPTGPAANNVMGVDNVPPFGVDEVSINSTQWVNNQIQTIQGHCSILGTC